MMASLERFQAQSIWEMSDKGIGFRLGALRKQHGGFGAMRFEAVIGQQCPDSSASAEFFVFVDGQKRFERRELRVTEFAAIRLTIPESAKTLTLVATDGGGSANDWVILGQPKLVIER